MILGAFRTRPLSITKAEDIYVKGRKGGRRVARINKKGMSSGVERELVVWYVIFYNTVIPVKYVMDDTIVPINIVT